MTLTLTYGTYNRIDISKCISHILCACVTHEYDVFYVYKHLDETICDTAFCKKRKENYYIFGQ